MSGGCRLQAGREAFSLLGGSDGGSVEAWKVSSMTKDERTKGFRQPATRYPKRATDNPPYRSLRFGRAVGADDGLAEAVPIP